MKKSWVVREYYYLLAGEVLEGAAENVAKRR
jgi:hypothetical protein